MFTIIQSLPVWLGQTETWLYNQLRHLPSDIDFHIICEDTQNLEQFMIKNIHSLKNASPLSYLTTKAMRRLGFSYGSLYSIFLAKQSKKYKGQLVHSHFGNVGWYNIQTVKQIGLPHIVTFYGYDINYLPRQNHRWYERYQELFNNVNYVLCEGSYMAESVVKLGCPRNKIQIHHLGVALDQLKFQPRKWNSNEPLRILIAASFREKKSIPYSIQALAEFQNKVSALEITIIGDANKQRRNQDEKMKILEFIRKYNLQSKIRFLGYQPYNILLQEAYNHHIFLSPSVTASDGDTEGGLPVTLIEMAATGMPVISTNHCDIPELIKHHKTGLLAEERDVNGLINNLKWLVDHNEEWSKIAINARKHIEIEYNVLVQAKKVSNFYKHVISS